jgi:DNA-binding response OmpR family regulator
VVGHEIVVRGAVVARVVVVDKEPDVRGLIALVLRKAGHEVVEAAGGDGALALLRRERPDVAVLDAELPEPSGVELALALAADPATAGTAVVLTSSAWEAARRDAAAIGAALVPEPFAPAELRAPVADALARRGASVGSG